MALLTVREPHRTRPLTFGPGTARDLRRRALDLYESGMTEATFEIDGRKVTFETDASPRMVRSKDSAGEPEPLRLSAVTTDTSGPPAPPPADTAHPPEDQLEPPVGKNSAADAMPPSSQVPAADTPSTGATQVADVRPSREQDSSDLDVAEFAGPVKHAEKILSLQHAELLRSLEINAKHHAQITELNARVADERLALFKMHRADDAAKRERELEELRLQQLRDQAEHERAKRELEHRAAQDRLDRPNAFELLLTAVAGLIQAHTSTVIIPNKDN